MAKLAMGFGIGVVLSVVGVLALVYTAGVQRLLGHERSAPEDAHVLDAIEHLPSSLFPPGGGWHLRVGYGPSLFRDGTSNRHNSSGGFGYRFTRDEGEVGDPMDKFLEVVRSVGRVADENGFGVPTGGVQAAMFGEDGYGPGPTVSLDGSNQLSGESRFAYVSLYFVSRDHPATSFQFTVVCDRKKPCTLILTGHCFSQSPVYTDPENPPYLPEGRALRVAER